MTRTSLHVFLSPATHESRFLREASAILGAGLADRVLLLALHDPGLAESEELAAGVRVERIRLRSRGLPRGLLFQLLKAREWRRRIIRRAREVRPDAIVAHSLAALPVGAAVARVTSAPLLYDAHELETERNGLRGIRQAVERAVERSSIRRARAVVCVGDAIADWYAKAYDIPRPFVVRNVSAGAVASPAPRPSFLRERFAVPDDALLFIYQGAFSRGRRIEQFLRIFARTGHHVVFMGFGELEGLVRSYAARHPNIHLQPAVAPQEVLAHTAGADVGLVGVENVCLSYYYSLPNKLFEYLSAGLPVIAPDYPEIRRLVAGHDCGWVAGESDDDWFERISTLSPAMVAAGRLGAHSATAAYSWPAEERAFLDAYRSLRGGSGR